MADNDHSVVVRALFSEICEPEVLEKGLRVLRKAQRRQARCGVVSSAEKPANGMTAKANHRSKPLTSSLLAQALVSLRARGRMEDARRLEALASNPKLPDSMLKVLLMCSQVDATSTGHFLGPETTLPSAFFLPASRRRPQVHAAGKVCPGQDQKGSAIRLAGGLDWTNIGAPPRRLFTSDLEARDLHVRRTRSDMCRGINQGRMSSGVLVHGSSSDAESVTDFEDCLAESARRRGSRGKNRNEKDDPSGARAVADPSEGQTRPEKPAGSAPDGIEAPSSLLSDVHVHASYHAIRQPCVRRRPVSSARWLMAIEASRDSDLEPRPELTVVPFELRASIAAALRRASSHPHYRMSAQIVTILLGCSSPLLAAEDMPGSEAAFGFHSPPVLAETPLELSLRRFPGTATCSRAARERQLVKELDRRIRLRNQAASRTWNDMHEFPPGHDAIVRRAYTCGRLFKSLSLFASAYREGNLSPSLQAMALHIAGILAWYADELMACIESDAPRESARIDPSLSAWNMLLRAEQSFSRMQVLEWTISEVEMTDGSAVRVLDALYNCAQTRSADQVLHKLFLAAAVPYLAVVWDWAFSASASRDPGGQFFGTQLGFECDGPEAVQHHPCSNTAASPASSNTDLDPQDAAFVPQFLSIEDAIRIVRAGRARFLLGCVSPKHRVLQVERPDCLTALLAHTELEGFLDTRDRLREYVATIRSVASAEERADPEPVNPEPQGGSGSVDEGAEAELMLDSNEQRAAAERRDERSLTPCTSSSVFKFPFGRETVLDTGSKRRGIGVCFHPWDTVPGSHKLRRVALEAGYDQRWPALDVLLESLLPQPIHEVDCVIQTAVYEYFENHVRVFDHLNALWKYALLGAGDFADALAASVNSASDALEKTESEIGVASALAPRQRSSLGQVENSPYDAVTRQCTTLARCLHAALAQSGADGDIFSRRFGLSVSTSPLRTPDKHDPIGSPSGNLSSLWDANIRVVYEAEFPLSWVVSTDIVDRHSVFFAFFLRLRRAKHCLRRLFLTFRRQSSLRAYSQHAEALLEDAHLCTRVWRFSWEAEHFVRIIGDYEATQVVGSSWSVFHDKIQEQRTSPVKTIWELRSEFVSFLDDSMRRALLGPRHRAVMKVIEDALDIIVTVEKRLTAAADPVHRYSSEELVGFLDEVNSASDNLQQRAKFLVDVLQRLLRNGVGANQSHLFDLLNRLNYNQFYASDPEAPTTCM